ncbi:DUF4450 domain-containing protein [Dysgonomonas macrotermitis]|uniref:DUF4450 domain-containing protein n=1 Tax=Dysgonomonas macrotermitis TaxID=1346286 RepID=A0A1M4TIQ6_9BACT|nr:DUF4450 domain-containing protein [Dysgonomonas macrotermitis]SHE44392.1 protein of unknown function [Dysgonomonas macrotermitis]
MRYIRLILTMLTLTAIPLASHSQGYWHGKERKLRYTPEGEDFVIVNGDKKFNRALYGTHTAFRVETGDIPEFGLFMPSMGGNIQLGLIKGGKSLWLNDAEYIRSIYRAGSRIYEIKDPFIGSGKITITVLALADAEGMVVKAETEGIASGIDLVCTFGGASNKSFSRNGDLGVDDPDAFALKPEACENNIYLINNNTFTVEYGKGTKRGPRQTTGIFPDGAQLKTASPYAMTTTTDVWKSVSVDNRPILVSRIPVESAKNVIFVIKNNDGTQLTAADLEKEFNKAEQRRQEVAGTVKITTPDPYFNTLGGVLSIAADGIWDEETACWQHGAVGWRMPLNGWRAAYVGDAIGWHDKARQHFDGYAASQITDIEPTIPHPAQDKELNLTRAAKIWGTQMYSNGYITRNPNSTKSMHHYDMNLCYIDELLWHFNWTGDMDYVRKMWPVLQRHLAWEKRNFDPNNDGLYDAYAGIWASDALQYNSGGVTHSSAYNYRANRMAAMIAKKIGENPKPYLDEAAKILKAINTQLWLPEKGWWAEYKDFMGAQMIHPNAAIWTVYHALDSEIHTPFQSYQATRYIDTEIPHIPVLAKGMENEGYQTIATTNWLPYSWSINNVAFAEVAHASLAYWQAGRYEEAYKLFKSSVLDGMYLGSSPGNIGQVSFYDAARGECYRDFADPIGVYSRTLIQGLFGILPDAMNDKLEVRPGFPAAWEYASVATPDISFDFKRNGTTDSYKISQNFGKELNLLLTLKAQRESITEIKVNGQKASWTVIESVGYPSIQIDCKKSGTYDIEIIWSGSPLDQPEYKSAGVKDENWNLSSKAKVQKIYDPQSVLKNTTQKGNSVEGIINGETGHRTLFVQLKQGQMTWWQPAGIEVKEPLTVIYNAEVDNLLFTLKNNTNRVVNAQLQINMGKKSYAQSISIASGETSPQVTIPASAVRFGSNHLTVTENGKVIFTENLINWNLKNDSPVYEQVNMDKVLNASVSQIFRNEYLTPRSPYTTLQVPKQGIGEWCHPTLTSDIDDSGIRKAVKNNTFDTPFGIPFRTVSNGNNIAFTTLWDNYPSQVSVTLSGKASHAYLMMAGSTNHMQSHVVNGTVTVVYKDGSNNVLNLVNPETWAPIEQDFYLDGQAFSSKQPRPYRVALKTGVVSRDMEKDMNIKPAEVYGRSIRGGAGIILDLPLNSDKELDRLEVKSIANEVVIGLMGITLMR